MAYRFAAGPYFNVAAVPVGAMPLTMACWFKSPDVTNSYSIMAMSDADGSERFILQSGGSLAGDPVRIVSIAASVQVVADSTTAITANRWQHACGVFASSTSKTALLNGGGAGTVATASTPGTITQTQIGANGIATFFYTGMIAEVGIWACALENGEVYKLAQGFSPLLVRPEYLVFYAPLNMDFIPVDVGAKALRMVPTSTPLHYNEMPPGMIYPTRPVILRNPPRLNAAAVAGGATVGIGLTRSLRLERLKRAA